MPFNSTHNSSIPFFRRAKFGKIGFTGRGRKLIVTLSCLAAFGVLFFQLSNGFREGGNGKKIPFFGGNTKETSRFGKSHQALKKAPTAAELRANPESKALMAKAMEALDAEDHATVIDTGLEIRNRFGFPEGTDGATLASTFIYFPAYDAAMELAKEDNLPFTSEWQTRFDCIPDPDSDSDPEACFLFGMVKMILAYQYMSKKDFETAQIVFASAKYYVSNEKSSLAKIPGVKDVLIQVEKEFQDYLDRRPYAVKSYVTNTGFFQSWIGQVEENNGNEIFVKFLWTENGRERAPDWLEKDVEVKPLTAFSMKAAMSSGLYWKTFQ